MISKLFVIQKVTIFQLYLSLHRSLTTLHKISLSLNQNLTLIKRRKLQGEVQGFKKQSPKSSMFLIQLLRANKPHKQKSIHT